jgi:hypothetical protein
MIGSLGIVVAAHSQLDESRQRRKHYKRSNGFSSRIKRFSKARRAREMR